MKNNIKSNCARFKTACEWGGRSIGGDGFAGSLLRNVFMALHLASKDDDNVENLNFMRDNYMLEFLSLPEGFKEKDLRKQIVSNLKQFILEFGKDFVFVGEEYRVQVGNEDFYIDLVFFHRELSCLVAFELKIGQHKGTVHLC